MIARIVCTAVAALACGSALAAPTVYTVDPGRSSIRIHVGKTGAFSFAGHRHEVEAPVSGQVTADPASIGGSSVALSFAAARFRVLPGDEPAGDPAKVEEVMRGPAVLEASQYPEVRFRSKSVTGQPPAGPGSPATYSLQITGELTIHGVTKEITLPVSVTTDGAMLTATGRAMIRHDEFGLKPVSAGGGTVKVQNEIGIDFKIVAEKR